MALKLKPPTHTVDGGGVYIHADDDAWDNDLINADMKAAEAKALAEFRDKVEAEYRDLQKQRGREVSDEEIAEVRKTCSLSDEQRRAAYAPLAIFRYQSGATRFDPDCADWDPEGKPCTVRERYLTKGKPTIFRIKRLRPSDYHAAEDLGESGERLLEFCRLGLTSIDSADFKWRREDDGKKRVPEEIIQALHDVDVSLPLGIGTAVILFCRTLNKAERFR